MSKDRPPPPIIDITDAKAGKTDIQLANAAEIVVPSHKGQIKPTSGVAMYPGAPTTIYFADCDEGCHWKGPVRNFSHEAAQDLERHMTDPGA